MPGGTGERNKLQTPTSKALDLSTPGSNTCTNSAWSSSGEAKYYRLMAAGKAQLSRERDQGSPLVDAIGRLMNTAPANQA